MQALFDLVQFRPLQLFEKLLFQREQHLEHPETRNTALEPLEMSNGKMESCSPLLEAQNETLESMGSLK